MLGVYHGRPRGNADPVNTGPLVFDNDQPVGNAVKSLNHSKAAGILPFVGHETA
jgi:hypothetical protein